MEKNIETAREFTKQMDKLARLLGRKFENSIRGNEEKLQVYREYWHFLEVYDLNIVIKAISKCLQEDIFWPKPARLIKLCEKELANKLHETTKLKIIQQDMDYCSEEAYENWLQQFGPEELKEYRLRKLKIVKRKQNTHH